MKKGYLEVGKGHKIYFEDWGNTKASPIFFLHGGPGGGTSERHKLLFNIKKHRVIFHDQRGSGKSKPYGSAENNTTQDLISDIEKLSKHLKINKFTLVGGSWGSTLSLVYAISYPERIKRLVIWGIYLARKFETDYVNEGFPKHTFPEAWERFISHVPLYSRLNGNSIMKYYAKKIRAENKSIVKKYSDEWILWESTLMSLKYDKKKLEAEVLKEDNIAEARLETHYFLNNCFLPKNYILKNIKKIKRIPCQVVQGRFDICTPPVGAIDLAKAYGRNLKLQFVNSGHVSREPETFVALKSIFNKL
ncbi:MAG: prolyl aminopeptidase [Candidatus Woesebacteria bacterium]|nr:prolyl aminopeptidase [Candidatus Woesebacteria bacterium]